MAYECVLPEEIIENIFARMPTKPLLRLKSLSKHWNRLISDPRFMKLRSRRMILIPTLPLHTIDLAVSGNEMTNKMINLHFPFGNLTHKYLLVVGTFNGIVFLVLLEEYVPDEMILYNPFTRRFKEIVPDPLLKPILYPNYLYGFCYGTTPDDLKIVRIEGYHSASDMISCDVYSFKNSSWCTKSVLMGGYHIYNTAGTFVNGFLYWIAKKELELILALDVKEMVLSEIQIPQGCLRCSLDKFKGRLCVMYIPFRCSEEYEIKVMNEHGFGKSWSMLCNIFSIHRDTGIGPYYKMCILDDGKLMLLMWPNRVIIHDILNGSYKEMKTSTRFSSIDNLQCFEYVESLISPFDMCSI